MSGGFDERMELLRARFRARALDDRARLLIALNPYDAGEVKRIAHGLSGAGGVFGYPDISIAGERVEDAVDAGVEEAEMRRLCALLLEQISRLA